MLNISQIKDSETMKFGQLIEHHKTIGQFCNQFFSKYTRKALANAGPKGEPIATPLTCL